MTETSRNSELRSLFDAVATLVRESPPNDGSTSSESRLRLYGLYKHVKDGPCSDIEGNGNAPSRLQVVAHAKHQAWLSCASLSETQAMLEYVELVAEQTNQVGRDCTEKLKEWKQTSDSTQVAISEDTSAALNHADETDMQDSDFAQSDIQTSFATRYLGIKPMTPRGRLDISYGDLWFAARQALRPSKMRRYCEIEEKIANLWTDQNVLVGLSVRSLLDMYLRAMSFEKGSQVIVTPPINIPGMMDVLLQHGIDIVPVDMTGTSLRVDTVAVEDAISKKTVAIMIVHPFGQYSTTSEDMQTLRDLADFHRLEIWDDRAECFAGVQGTVIDSKADLVFLSFGTIKTATALGGGISFVRDESVMEKMKRLHYTLYKSQSSFAYLRRIGGCAMMKFLTEHPMMYGFVFLLCHWAGVDFDWLVTSCIRNFAARTPHQLSGSGEVSAKLHRRKLTRQLRRRPSVALLSLLHRRLMQNQLESPVVLARSARCKVMSELLANVAPSMTPISVSFGSTYWLFPLLANDSYPFCRALRLKGWDITRGSSQLQCIGQHSSDGAVCSRAHDLMDRVVYLPVSSIPMCTRELRRLAVDVRDAISLTSRHCDVLKSRRNDANSKPSFRLMILISCAVIFPLVALGSPCLGAVSFILLRAVRVGLFFLFLAVAVTVLLRRCMSDLYTDGSRCFAKYCSCAREDGRNTAEKENDTDETPLLKLEALRIPNSPADNPGGAVILTGATGFIGSLVLRDLLLHRQSLGITEGVILFCRSRRGCSAKDRVSVLLNKPMFSFLLEAEKAMLVRVFDSDVTKKRAGLSEGDYSWVCNEAAVSHVIHCAASVSFTQSLNESAVANISSSLNMQELTGRLKNPGARYVHFSTAFVHGELAGTVSSPLPERLHPLGTYDAVEVYRSMIGTQFYASSAMNDLGFPNTYTFSKCVCEHILLQESPVHTTILRPSIVGPAIQKPIEGWAGERPSTLVAAACLYIRYQWNLWCFGAHRVPCIPVDVVSRFAIAKAFTSVDRSNFVDSPSSAYSSDDDFERITALTDSSSCGSGNGERVIFASCANKSIYNVAWDVSSPDSTAFTWVEYAVAITQLGSVMGYFSRLTAYIGLMFAVSWLPRMKLTVHTFALMHEFMVRKPVDTTLRACGCIGWRHKWLEDLSRLTSFLDLPLLFFPFMNNDFRFRSDLVAPASLDGERYLFTCTASASRFLDKSEDANKAGESAFRLSPLLVGGALYEGKGAGFLWAMTQPRGGFVIRLAGWAFGEILCACCESLTVDVESFAALARAASSTQQGIHPHIILAPTHRSFFDFILLSYIAFSLPEMGLQLPYIAAADDFSRLPLIGWLARTCNAFFVQRGRGSPEPGLRDSVSAIKQHHHRSGACIEIFVEGTRSRDRRSIPPKTGLLRCLAETGGNHLICPIGINYENIAEESTFLEETETGTRAPLGVRGLVRWLQNVVAGNVSLGKIHVAAASPVRMGADDVVDFASLTRTIQQLHQESTFVSTHHIRHAARALRMDEAETIEAVAQFDGKPWPSTLVGCSCRKDLRDLDVPSSSSQQWSVFLQFGHVLAPYFAVSHPNWSSWLNPLSDYPTMARQEHPSAAKLVRRVSEVFDLADSSVLATLNHLRANGFDRPSLEHAVQITTRRNNTLPIQVVRAAVSFQVTNSAKHDLDGVSQSSIRRLREMPDDDELSVSLESLGSWGFKDSGFVLRKTQDRSLEVVMTGSRYEHVCGKSLTKLIPFFENETKVRIDPLRAAFSGEIEVPEVMSELSRDDIDQLKDNFARVSTSPADRARHGTGHSQEDIFLLRSGSIDSIRLPDAVVWPSSEDEITHLVTLAKTRSWCLIPHGGGTNVSNATRCPSKTVEPRPIVSVDMKLMTGIVWVNEEDGLAHVEAGITGRQLVEEMEHRGYTIGHEPDSIEFSTLGGWIATKASGMKRNKYGNIEDIVQSVRVASSEGPLWRGSHEDISGSVGRESRGLDLCSLMLGSEGCFGIITSAVIRIWHQPECKDYESVILPDFEHGLRFARELALLGPNLPASVRLLDNEQFRLGQALRGDTSSLEQLVNFMKKALVSSHRSYSSTRVVCATIVFEGSREEVNFQRRLVQQASSTHGGTLAGPKIGRSGYQLTFAIAYLRDFAMTYSFLAESFETFAPWSKLTEIVTKTKDRIRQEHETRCFPGLPFIGCRVTQLYHEGACLYFYFCMNVAGVKNPSASFAHIENAARQEILSLGGSLSHHHGVGKKRADFAEQLDSENYRNMVSAFKRTVDPSNTFGARNGIIR